MNNQLKLPDLHYKGNENKEKTLHLFLQIIGKIRLEKAPRKNHWWYITQYVGPRGFTTGSIPYNSGIDQFDITLNVQKHQLEVNTSQGDYEYFLLNDKLSVADFYQKLMVIMHTSDSSVSIVAVPFDLRVEQSFNEITTYHYAKAYTEILWRTMV